MIPTTRSGQGLGPQVQVLPGRILVVDDYAEILAVVAKLLTNVGYRVTSATSGEDALRRITAGSDIFDLLLTDLDLGPGMWGDELVRQARAYVPSLHAMVMASYPDQLKARSQRVWSEVTLLYKPFAPAELLTVVQAVLTEDTMLASAHSGEPW